MPTLRQLRAGNQEEERWGLSDLAEWIQASNVQFPAGVNLAFPGLKREPIAENYLGYVQGVYKRSGVVYACMAVRQSIFAEVRFRYQAFNNGKPGDLFGTADLDLLEHPWPNGSTGELAAHMIQDVDLAGNFYAVKAGGRLWRRRPDKIVIALDGNPLVDEFVNVSGYLYYPNGTVSGNDFHTYDVSEMCHWSPTPDPVAEYRGMSWLTPILREVQADSGATDHKLEFFDNAAPQPLSARVLTPSGWRTMGEMAIDAEVIGSDGQAHRVTGVYPQGTKEIYRVSFQDGTAAECTADHLWTVSNDYDRRRGVVRNMTLAELIEDGFHYLSGPSKWAVPIVDPIEFEDGGDLPIDPYLLGLLLGDGSFRGGRVGLACAAGDADETAEILAPVLPQGVTITRRDRGGWSEFSFRGKGAPYASPLTTAIRDLGLGEVAGGDKFIPASYLKASVKDRVALLQGLVDSDGHIGPTCVRITTTSQALSACIKELAGSLGGVATIRPNSGRTTLTVGLRQLPPWIVPARLLRKASRYQPSSALRVKTMVGAERVRDEEAQCIRVDVENSLYVTDDFILTHNTPQMVVKTPADVMTVDQFDAFKAKMDAAHTGRGNRNKTLFLAPGADVQVVGRDFSQMDFANTQGRDEARIASAAGVPGVIVGIKESMQGSSLNAGNYAASRRRLADATMRPLYRSAASALEKLVPPPTVGSRLWYDASQVAFFREDRRDAADIQQVKAQTIHMLVIAGFEPSSAVKAVEAEDPTLLVHSGLYSIQLQAPGSQRIPGTIEPAVFDKPLK